MNIRTTFVMVMFLSVIAGFFLLADFRGDAASEPSAPWFYTANMEDIRRITFTTPSGSIGFYQQTGEGADPTWRFNDEFGMPLDLGRWGGITLLLSGPQSRRALIRDLKEEDRTRYGVDKPQLSVDVRLTGEREVKVHLGDRTPDNLNYYITQEDNPGLYLIDGTWGEVLSKISNDPPYPPWFYKIDGTKVLFFTVTRDSAEVSFLRERFIGEPDRWRFSGKDGQAVDTKRWNAKIMPILGGPKDLKLVKKGITDPAEFGLGSPSTAVRVEYEPPFEPQQDDPDPEVRRVLEIQVGKMLPDGSGYYAQVKGRDNKDQPETVQDYVFFVDKPWVEAMSALVTDPPNPPAAAP